MKFFFLLAFSITLLVGCNDRLDSNLDEANQASIDLDDSNILAQILKDAVDADKLQERYKAMKSSFTHPTVILPTQAGPRQITEGN